MVDAQNNQKERERETESFVQGHRHIAEPRNLCVFVWSFVFLHGIRAGYDPNYLKNSHHPLWVVFLLSTMTISELESGKLPNKGASSELAKAVVHEVNSQHLTSILLNGRNFLPWSRAVTIALGGRLRLGQIIGQTKAPDESHPNFEEWQGSDHGVMTWIFNSMEPKIYEIFAYSDLAKTLWDSFLRCMVKPIMHLESLSFNKVLLPLGKVQINHSWNI